MKQKEMITIMATWLEKQPEVILVASGDEDGEIRFKDKKGQAHRVFVSNFSKTDGAFAASSELSGKLLRRFAEEVVGKKGKVIATDLRIPKDSVKDGNVAEHIRTAVNDGPEGIKRLLGENDTGMDHEKHLAMAEEAYNELKKLAEEFGDPEKIKELKRLGKLLGMAKLAMTMAKEGKDISEGERQFRMLEAGDRVQECKMRELNVGEKFFDADYSLNQAVGFDKGKVGGDYVNSVIMLSNNKENHDGLPVKRDLDEIVWKTDL